MLSVRWHALGHYRNLGHPFISSVTHRTPFTPTYVATTSTVAPVATPNNGIHAQAAGSTKRARATTEMIFPRLIQFALTCWSEYSTPKSRVYTPHVTIEVYEVNTEADLV